MVRIWLRSGKLMRSERSSHPASNSGVLPSCMYQSSLWSAKSWVTLAADVILSLMAVIGGFP